jgi:hypothetical protein
MKKSNFNKAVKSLIVLTVVFITSCTKENTGKVTLSKTTKELLIAHNWIMTEYKMKPGLITGKDTLTDIFSDIADCDKDGYIKFTANDTIIYNNGEVKCLPNEPKENKTRYVINNESKWTEYFSNTKFVEYAIIELNETTLLYTFESNEQNKKQLNTIKLVKK